MFGGSFLEVYTLYVNECGEERERFTYSCDSVRTMRMTRRRGGGREGRGREGER